MNMVYAFYIAAACPFVKTYDVFRIIVGDSLQIAKLTLLCGFIMHEIRRLYVDHILIYPCHKIDLTTACLLPCEHLITQLRQM